MLIISKTKCYFKRSIHLLTSFLWKIYTNSNFYFIQIIMILSLVWTLDGMIEDR